MKLKEILRGLGDVVFPPVCVYCRGLVESGGYRYLCERCAPLLHFARPPHCPTCGMPFYGAAGEEGVCLDCVGLLPAYRTGATAVLFRGPARAMMLELKYHGGRHVLRDMEAIFRRSPSLLASARGAVLVPVPLHPRKERERGYNQSTLLAGALARAVGGNVLVKNILRRTVDTPSQTGLGRGDRQENLKNAFALRVSGALNPRLRYLLVDDVFTTGSTLNSCARVLRRAGCLNLDVATFGHG